MQLKKGLYIMMAILATGVGLYPLAFIIIGRPFELSGGKGMIVLTNIFWYSGFYMHIIFGSTALLTGWVQFSKVIRSDYLQTHRQLGKVYVGSVLLSAIGGFSIGFFASGGLITSVGFMSLGLIWFYSTIKAYLDIREKKIARHQKMMIYSYAACLAAVTLRLWEPLLDFLLNDQDLAYKIAAWWCWVPNLLVAHFLIIKRERTA